MRKLALEVVHVVESRVFAVLFLSCLSDCYSSQAQFESYPWATFAQNRGSCWTCAALTVLLLVVAVAL